jgi:thiamine-phosphate diphosphorylase/hydroxyethylthiazole kinase
LRSTEVASRGVDSGRGQAFKDPAEIVRRLARKERCVVVMTGEVDWISDENGERVVKIENGNELVRLDILLEERVPVGAERGGIY